MKKRLFVFVFVALLLSVSGLVSAQPTTIITVTAPDYYGSFFEETIIPQFEEAHPGIAIQFVYESQHDANDLGFPPLDEASVDEYFDKAEAYVSLADVLFLPSWTLTPALTRGRYLLDLTPLVTTDDSLDVEDFIPAAWESVQWDGGVWLLPVSARVELLNYNVDAFDAAGLDYPNENWSLTDLLEAAHALTVFDDTGAVELPGIARFDPALVIQSLTGASLQDETVIPVRPDFSSPEIAALVQEWLDFSESHPVVRMYEFQAVPMHIGEPQMLRGVSTGFEGTWATSLLPGGHAGVAVDGFAVSAGTAYPELAYEFAKFLTSNPELITLMGNTPARRSLVGIEPEDNFFAWPAYPPETQAIIDNGFEHALPASEQLFADFLWQASRYASEDGLDAAAALQRLEQEVLALLDTADRRGESTTIVVTIPEQVVVEEDDITLHFAMNTLFGSGPDRSVLDRVVEEFVAAHPQVGDVQIDAQMLTSEGLDDDIDCFYSLYNPVGTSVDDFSDFLVLDPLMDADPNFDRSDFVPQVLDQARWDNATYVYPLDIQPDVVVYDSALFAEADVPEPVDGWDTNAFHQALIAVQQVQPNQNAPVFSTAQAFSNTYLLMLIAAYGGIPYDIRTDPPTLNLTEPETIEATRQVAQLVHDGLFDYQPLASFSFDMSGGGGDMPIVAGSFNQSNVLLSRRDEIAAFGGYRATTYPTGSRFMPVSFSIGAGFIMADTPNIQACYDWLRHLAGYPELFEGVPASIAQIDNPAFAAAKGEDGVAVARTLVETLSQPNVLVMPGALSGPSGSIQTWLEPYMLNFTFDAIMLDGADVEIAYAEAQSDLELYRECTAGIPEPALDELQTQEGNLAYMRQLVDCAAPLVPELREQMSYLYDE